MAAITLALVQSAAPLVFPLVAKLVDKIFGAKNGPTVKLPVAVTVAQAVMKALQQQFPTGISFPIDAAEIQQIMQTTVDALNAKGELNGSSTVVDTGSVPLPA